MSPSSCSQQKAVPLLRDTPSFKELWFYSPCFVWWQSFMEMSFFAEWFLLLFSILKLLVQAWWPTAQSYGPGALQERCIEGGLALAGLLDDTGSEVLSNCNSLGGGSLRTQHRIKISGRRPESKICDDSSSAHCSWLWQSLSYGGLEMKAVGQNCCLASDALEFPKSLWMAFSVSGTWFPLKRFLILFYNIPFSSPKLCGIKMQAN